MILIVDLEEEAPSKGGAFFVSIPPQNVYKIRLSVSISQFIHRLLQGLLGAVSVAHRGLDLGMPGELRGGS